MIESRHDSRNIGRNTRLRFGWPLYKIDWLQLEELGVTSHAGWRDVLFSPYNEQSIPMDRGVYMMVAKPAFSGLRTTPFSDFLSVIYAGSADNLRNRFLRHQRTPSAKVAAAKQAYSSTITFWYLSLPDLNRNQIYDIEYYLINAFGPPACDIRGHNPTEEGEVGEYSFDVSNEIPVSDLQREHRRRQHRQRIAKLVSP